MIAEPADADAIIVTPAVLSMMQKSPSTGYLNCLNEARRKHPAAGCFPRYREELQKLPPEDIFIGVNEYHKLPRYSKNIKRGNNRCLGYCGKGFTEMTARTCLESHTAYLKISEGCDNVCTYCVILDRGHYRSRK